MALEPMASIPLSLAVWYLLLCRPDSFLQGAASVVQVITLLAAMVDQAAVVATVQARADSVAPAVRAIHPAHRLLKVMQAVQALKLLMPIEGVVVAVQELLAGLLQQVGMAVRVQRLQ